MEKSSNESRRENEKKNVGKRKNTHKLCKPGEKLFIRLCEKAKDSLKKHRVLIDRILKRYKNDATYLVKVKIPGEAELSVQKVRIANIVDNFRLPKQNQLKQTVCCIMLCSQRAGYLPITRYFKSRSCPV